MDILSINSKKSRKQFILERNSQFVLTELCRLCGNASGELLSICESGHKNELGRKIEKHLPVQISENDYLPQQVCYNCANTVLAWHDLTEKVLKIKEKFDEILREMSQVEMDSRNENKVAQPAAAAAAAAPALDPAPAVCLCIETHKSSLHSMNSIGEKLVSVSHENVRSEQPSVNNTKQDTHQFHWNKQNEGENCAVAKSSEYRDVFLFHNCETSPEQKIVHNELCFDKEGELTAHMLNNSSDSIYHCDKCDKLFKEKAKLVVHMKCHHHHHPNENVDERCQSCVNGECENSGENILSEDHSYCSADSMQKNQKKSNKSELVCSVCECSFTQKSDLKQHCQKRLENVNFKETSSPFVEPVPVQDLKLQKFFCCEKCGRNFATKDSYIRHYRIHTGEKPFTCDVCGKQFRDGGGLRRHLRDVHDRIKSFGCDICGRFFASKATREDHRRIHTGERPYICHCCGKSFKSKASLYIHSKIHTDNFPHHCTYCEKNFRRRQELINHTTTHTGEKPHVCEICGKSFGVRGEMLRHKVTHSEDRPFVCSVCGLGFKQKRYLKKHERTHKNVF